MKIMDEQRKENIKFSEAADKKYGYLDKNICRFHAKGESFQMEEKDSTGQNKNKHGVGDAAAKIRVSSAFPCFQLPDPDKNCKFSVLVKKDNKWITMCADHMVFLFNPHTEQWSVHIFEFKAEIDESIWEYKTKPQFNGALIRANAILGILHMGRFASVYVHCGYRREKENHADLSENRTLLGEDPDPSWKRATVELPSFQGEIIRNSPVYLHEGYDPIWKKVVGFGETGPLNV